MLKKKRVKRFLFILLLIIVIGFILPQQMVIPVEGASSADWNAETFWYYPWGKSVTHKGVDIFGQEGVAVLSATRGLVIYKGELGRGGNVIFVLGPKWRLHYYAHLQSFDTRRFRFVKRGEKIGALGKTGNASNTPPHLHYSIITPVPYPWRIDSNKQGWKKMFYLNPLHYF